MRIHRGDENGGELINISSLVDVMFILIIFFLATTTFQQEERGAKVSLPEAGEADTLSAAPKVVVINVRADGSYYLADRQVEAGDLQEAILEALRGRTDPKVLVRGDRQALHGHVAAAVLASKRAGVNEANIGYQLVQ